MLQPEENQIVNICDPRLLRKGPVSSIDMLVAYKQGNLLQAFSGGRLVKDYRVAFGRVPDAKQGRGDHRTPEGSFKILDKNTSTRFTLFMLFQGRDVGLHGPMLAGNMTDQECLATNWTYGCVAMPLADIQEIYRSTRVNTPFMIHGLAARPP